MIRLFAILFIPVFLNSCGGAHTEMQVETGNEKKSADQQPDTVHDMKNPLLMNGKDIGNLYRDLFLKKAYAEMLVYTSSTVIARYGSESLVDYLANADLKSEMLFDHKSDEGDVQVMYYRIGDQLKRLRVVEEDDTMRVWPLDVEQGRILE